MNLMPVNVSTATSCLHLITFSEALQSESSGTIFPDQCESKFLDALSSILQIQIVNPGFTTGRTIKE